MTERVDHTDILYKLGAIEAIVTTGMENLKSQVNDIKKLVEDNRTETKRELENVKTRLDKIEDWKKAVVERVTIITGLGLLVWAVVGDVIKNAISRIFE